MTLATDANFNATQIRESDPIGGYLSLSTGSSWHRVMPDGNTAEVVSDNDRQLDIGTLRSDILDVVGWNLMVLNSGYFEQHKIREFAGGVATLQKPLEFHKGLEILGNAVEWVIYPTIDLPLNILYRDGGNTAIDIGVAKENVYAPTPKKYTNLETDETLAMPTRQIQKIFYKGAASGAIAWGEHCVRR